jgi:hypothetical protein
MKMRKIAILIIILFASFYCNGQSLLSVQNGNIKDTNMRFDLELNPISTPPDCTSQTITLNIGKLVYLPDYIAIPNGVIVKSIIDGNGNTILTISNILSAVGGRSQTLLISVKFSKGTCDGYSQEVSANLTAVNCGSTRDDAQPSIIQVISKTPNNAKVNLSQVIQNSQNSQDLICLGDVIKYRVTATNIGENGYVIKNAKLSIVLKECAQIIGLYKHDSYNPVDYSNTLSELGTKTYEWSTPNLDAVPDRPRSSYPNDYDVYVVYPCNASCFSQQQDSKQANNALVQAYLKGESDCIAIVDDIPTNSTVNVDLPVVSLSTAINPDCPLSNCESSGTLLYDIVSRFPCPIITSCDTKSSLAYRINISPTSPSYSNLVFTTNIPSGLNIVSLNAPLLPCEPVVSAYINGAWIENPSSYNAATQVKWVYNCIAYAPVDFNTFNIVFDYGGSPPQPNAVFPFEFSLVGKLESEDKIIVSGRREIGLQSCSPDIRLYKEVKKAAASIYNEKTLNGVPSEKFTYRLTIQNVGATNAVNSVIEDVLDVNSEYAGNLKYSFVDSGTNPQTFTPIFGNSITIAGLGEAKITLPSASSQLLSMSGFSLPAFCPTQKTLYIEFDVKIKSKVSAGTDIRNRFKVTQNSLTTNSDVTDIIVSALTNVSSEMFVGCPTTGNWVKSVDVIDGQELNFRMRLTNEGSLPVSLIELINLKPQVDDIFEFGNLLRNSEFTINYDCSFGVSFFPRTPSSGVNILYSNTGVNLDRSGLVCPSASGGSAPNWTATCSASSNWIRTQFVNGLNLPPGDYIEVIYKGKVSGPSGVAFNTFAFKVKQPNGDCINSDKSDIIIINIDPSSSGCSSSSVTCDYCASFDLIKEKKYLVSGWVKVSDPDNTKLQVEKYEKVCIGVSFTDSSGITIIGGTDSLNTTPSKFYPIGEIIDGWQRIIGEFTVPINADDIQIELINENIDSKMAYFDDIRVLPTNGNMKSFVYDQKTQRLMAELDENNYSTFYEYDLEGGLIRIKKETEKGIFTIQETRSSSPKSK